MKQSECKSRLTVAESTSSLASNFSGVEKGWELDDGEGSYRPEYIEWKNGSEPRRLFRVFEIFPFGKSAPNYSYICSGSDSQLVQSVISQYMQTFCKEGNTSTVSSVSTTRQQHPLLRFYFRENPLVARNESRNPADSLITTRTLEDSSQLTIETMKKYRARILDEFKSEEKAFTWRKGKTLFCYADWKMGYQIQLLCHSEKTAKIITEKIHRIKGAIPDDKCYYVSSALNPDKTYPEEPGTRTVLGHRTIRNPRYRPIADVSFKWADILIPDASKKYTLVSTKGCRRVWSELLR